jgi:diguanylate cyclase (GGDEF)-like protein
VKCRNAASRCRPFSPAGPTTSAGRVVSGIFAIAALAWALVWWFGPWPARRWSIAFIAFSDIGIPVVSALDSDHLAGFFGLNLLLLVSVHVKFFDGPKLLVAHTVWALAWVLAFSFHIATAGEEADPYLATAKTLAAIAVLVAIPIAVHFGVWVLRGEADAAMTDALTGLLNRRGLHLLLGGLLAGTPANDDPPNAAMVVIVIDLDRFKEVNDTYGHAAGDHVLVRTASRIRSATRSPALIARVGGEEFVVLDRVAPEHMVSIAQRICDAIAAPAEHSPVTASIGVVTLPSPDVASPDGAAGLLELAIAEADHAMFAVKRQGGNAVSVSNESRRSNAGPGVTPKTA